MVGNGSCSGVYPVVVDLLGSEGDRPLPLHHLPDLRGEEEQQPARLLLGGPDRIAGPHPIGRRPFRCAPPSEPDSGVEPRGTGAVVGPEPRRPGVDRGQPGDRPKIEDSKSSRAREALTALGELAASGPSVHQFIAEPYVPVNLGALSAAGVTTEIAGQMQGGQSIMVPLLRGPATSDQPSGTTWVASGAVDAATVKGLRFRYVDASHLVLPDTDLPPATEREATWSQPFALSAGRGQKSRRPSRTASCPATSPRSRTTRYSPPTSYWPTSP